MSTPADLVDLPGLTRVLIVGDVFGRPGRKALSRGIDRITRSFRLDAIIINGENLAGGKGLNLKTVSECFGIGVTAVTTGNHLFDQKDTGLLLETEERVLRPLNLSPECPGKGASIFALPNGKTLGVINLIGRVFMAPSDCPFHAVDRTLSEWEATSSMPDLIAVDFHGEASGEKRAMGFHLDGRVNMVYGTHTHVQTNDLETLPGGTLFLTDVGLTGPRWSVIGVAPKMALKKYLTHVPAPFEVAEGEMLFCGLLASFEEDGGRLVLKEARLIREGDLADET
ncbi:MAG: TIGR00282 family metallophosphoesterase [Leptospirales bacterium]